jgi:hypothetical protein
MFQQNGQQFLAACSDDWSGRNYRLDYLKTHPWFTSMIDAFS